jgi:hypothetical protein
MCNGAKWRRMEERRTTESCYEGLEAEKSLPETQIRIFHYNYKHV